jgi:hypothetical protein
MTFHSPIEETCHKLVVYIKKNINYHKELHQNDVATKGCAKRGDAFRTSTNMCKKTKVKKNHGNGMCLRKQREICHKGMCKKK